VYSTTCGLFLYFTPKQAVLATVFYGEKKTKGNIDKE
jgi:hypothetical protein